MNSKLKQNERVYVSTWGVINGDPIQIASEGTIERVEKDGRVFVKLEQLKKYSNSCIAVNREDIFPLVEDTEGTFTKITPDIFKPILADLKKGLGSDYPEEPSCVLELELYNGSTLAAARVNLETGEILDFQKELLWNWYTRPIDFDHFKLGDVDGDYLFETEDDLFRLQSTATSEDEEEVFEFLIEEE